MQQAARPVLLIVVILLLVLFFTRVDGLIGIGIIMALPFLAYAIAALYVLFKTSSSTANLIKGKSPRKSKPVPVWIRRIAAASVAAITTGIVLFATYLLRGGPNKNPEGLLLGGADNRYLDMQIAMILIAAGCLLSLALHYRHKIKIEMHWTLSSAPARSRRHKRSDDDDW